MKPSIKNPLLSSALLIAAASSAFATDLYWDADGATTSATGGAGTWQSTSTWRSGSATGTLGNWTDGTSPYNTAIFGGTAGDVALTSNVTLNQIKFLVGGNSSAIYNIGKTGSGTITFGGSYSSTTPTIDATAISSASGSATISAKITGNLSSSGGLYIKAINKMIAGYSTATVGRIYLTAAAANDFIGDVTIDGGSVHSLSSLGNANNKIILKNGGGLYGNSGSSVNYDLTRDIVVDATGGAVGSFASGGATVITKLASGKTISGSGNLTRYQPASIVGTEEVWLLGGMSGYTGTFENVAGTTLIQTAATSAGTWKLTGGTLKLNTTDDTHIADGAGKSNLLMNGGTLDMNGKNETINGLEGSSTASIVQNQLGSSTSTLTLGAGDATASFGGVLRDNTTSGGTLALIKTGSGTQTLTGTNLYSGTTAVNGGTLKVSGSIANSAVTVNNTGTVLASGASGTFGKSVTVNNGAILAAGGLGAVGSLVLDGSGTTGTVLSMATGSIFDWDLSGNGGTSDQINFWNYNANDFALNGNTVNLNLSGTKANGTYTVDLFKFYSNSGTSLTASGITSGLSVGTLGSGISNPSFNYNSGGNTISLTYTVVPEPTGALVGLLVGAGLLRRRRTA